MTVLDQSPNQHLEHIMPQTANVTDWPHLYANLITEELDEKFSSYVNRIGNHTVFERDINGHIKNKKFTYKDSNPTNKDYQHSTLKLPAVIKNYLNHNLWDFKSIDDRGKDLAQHAVNTWTL
jgi:hypothetical protein